MLWRSQRTNVPDLQAAILKRTLTSKRVMPRRITLGLMTPGDSSSFRKSLLFQLTTFWKPTSVEAWVWTATTFTSVLKTSISADRYSRSLLCNCFFWSNSGMVLVNIFWEGKLYSFLLLWSNVFDLKGPSATLQPITDKSWTSTLFINPQKQYLYFTLI